MPNPDTYSLVVNSMFVSKQFTYRFSRVLIDSGSNILYRKTMIRLGLWESYLDSNNMVFHDIVPGLSYTPIGRIRLDVMFGSPDNFWREPLWFEVTDLSSPYHAHLGKPALAKFMVIPHHAYLKMEMSSPHDVITVVGDYRCSIECAQAGSKLPESHILAAEKC